MKRKDKAHTKIQERVNDYCQFELKKVNVESKTGLYNRKCFHNACDYASANKDVKVVLGIYIDKNTREPFLHLWVRENGKDLEVSLGYLVEKFEYYELKILDESEYLEAGVLFNSALEYYKEKLTTTYERFWIKEDRIL